ncbi:hypothetical protein SAG0007_00505 [Streptococcus agalactiae FSL C1-487]|uniref:Uncharacterized protein n=1 Tax=Streptococcus agalactiae MRI Z1-216 TaxID=1154879 RepID=A0AAD3A4Z2_STRAG|nr:hypothetical protein SAG0161_00120 [Streptococcus agalactiae MRI Z1-213]EPU34272.1 hypothetical protein SAG0162_00035 [Streptococcus agalactiae MRI Z1-214]EPU38281.1 hypothetical protein SAG0164_01470 [Streptococcus agalactiae MRI Z1-216]EPV81778.1 hypothetical protein SAG0007_00505 [Streptococcus agalactiae FSL C1-487]EPV90265.1 hypothetical protein SAG0023_06840 [Streptococcus agalactiae FSL S3-105]
MHLSFSKDKGRLKNRNKPNEKQTEGIDTVADSHYEINH